MAVKGDWVQVHIVVLQPEQRAHGIPDDTHGVPLEMWVKGTLLDGKADLGDTVSVLTRTKRTVSGTMCAVNPSFSHSFGDFVPELLTIDETVRGIVFGGEAHA